MYKHTSCLPRRDRRVMGAVLAAVAMFSLAAAPTGAAVVYDGFETYTAAGTLNAAGAAGNGWSEAWAADTDLIVDSIALGYSNGTVAVDGGGKAVKVTKVDGLAARRGLTTQLTAGTVYFSFLLRPVTVSSNDNLLFALGWQATSNTLDPSGNVGLYDNLQFYTESRRTGGGGNLQRVLSGVNAATNTTYMIVGKLEKGFEAVNANDYDHVTIFINPTSSTVESGTSVSATYRTDLTGIDEFIFRAINIASTESYYWDELRIATTWQEVVPAAAPAPEPATLALLVLGGLGLAAGAVRRRRTA